MIENESSHMSDRFWTEARRAAVLSARTNDQKVGPPLGGTVYNFTLRTSLPFQNLRAWEMLQSLL
jgi:hypothetical protein